MIGEKPHTVFDTIADVYYSLIPALPEQYIQLILQTLTLTPTDTIIDLGCGSGDLALALRNVSSFVQGIDVSGTMISLAREKDQQQQVTWIQQSVEDFDLGEETYNLIISFESFHLFPNPRELIKRCAKALKPGGALCIGWRMYAFDIPLKNALEETFAAHNIPYEWGFWTCPAFPAMVREAKQDCPFLTNNILI